MKKLSLVLLLLFSFATLSFSSSMNCTNEDNLTRVEKMFCENPGLLELDKQMKEAYKYASITTKNKKLLEDEQKLWLEHIGMCFERDCVDAFYKTRIARLQNINKVFVTYADILENNTKPYEYSQYNQFLYDEHRKANNYILRGGSKNKICQETLSLFNEEGNFKRVIKYDDFDYVYWHINNSGLILWEPIYAAPSEMKISEKTFKFGLEYVEIDIDGDGIIEHVYRFGEEGGDYGLVTFLQSIHVSNEKLQDNLSLMSLEKYPDDNIYISPSICYKNRALCGAVLSGNYDEWESTKNFGYDNILRFAASDMESIKILYPKGRGPKNSIGINGEVFWSLHKIKSKVVLVSSVYSRVCGCGNAVPVFYRPQFLVFSLHKNKQARLECIIEPKEW